jgi:hypothetical protein
VIACNEILLNLFPVIGFCVDIFLIFLSLVKEKTVSRRIPLG